MDMPAMHADLKHVNKQTHISALIRVFNSDGPTRLLARVQHHEPESEHGYGEITLSHIYFLTFIFK